MEDDYERRMDILMELGKECASSVAEHSLFFIYELNFFSSYFLFIPILFNSILFY